MGATIANLAAIAPAAPLSMYEVARQALPRDPRQRKRCGRSARDTGLPLVRLRASRFLRNPADSLILAFMEHPSSTKRSVEPQPSRLFAVAAAPTSGPLDVYALLFVGPSSDALLAARRERNIGRTGVSVL